MVTDDKFMQRQLLKEKVLAKANKLFIQMMLHVNWAFLKKHYINILTIRQTWLTKFWTNSFGRKKNILNKLAKVQTMP